MTSKKPIYLDHNATSPPTEAHITELSAALLQVQGNPSSQHSFGRDAKIALEATRQDLAELIGARTQEIIFTSGATEANNTVIQGFSIRENSARKSALVVVTAADHSSVIESAQLMTERGWSKTSLAPVDTAGRCREDALQDLLKEHSTSSDSLPVLVCIIHGNNEVGAVNDIALLATIIKKIAPNAHVHCDCVQTLGKIDLNWLGKSLVDSASFSGHKLGALAGIGALYLKTGTKLAKLLAGGGQERSRRPGTENLPGILSLGLRIRDLKLSQAVEEKKMMDLRNLVIKNLQSISGLVLHTHTETFPSLPNTVNFHVDGIRGEDILLNLDLEGVAASSGSACSTGVNRPSHVLKAMGYDDWVALNSIRFSWNTRGCTEDLDHVIEVLRQTTTRLKSLSAGNVRGPG